MIFVSSDGNQTGGVYNFVMRLARHFDSSVIVIDKTPSYQPNLLSRFGYPPIYMFNVFRLWRKLRGHSIVVLNDPQVTTITLAVVIFAILTRKKVVFISHGFLFHNSAGLLKKFYFWLSKQLILRFLVVVAVGKPDYKLVDTLPRVHLIEHGVPAYPSRPKDIDFVCVGRDAPNKNLDKFVEFHRLATCKNKSFVLISATNRFDRYAADNPGFSILKHLSTEAYRDTLARAKYFVSFSDYEGFGLSLVEAMRCGAIPICFANASFSRILEGGKAFLVAQNKPTAFWQKIADLEGIQFEDCDFLKNRSLDYSEEKMLAQYENIFFTNQVAQ